MKRWIAVATVLVVSAVCLFAVRQGQTRAEQAPRSVKVAIGSIAQEALAIGNVVPEQEISVKSKVPGIVSRVHVEVGDMVRAGDPLIDIRPDPTPLERAEAERNHQLARVIEDGARRELERTTQLASRGLLPERELDGAVQAYETARLRAKISGERLQLLKEGRVTLEGAEVGNLIGAPAAGTVLNIDASQGDPVVPLTSYQAGTVLLTMADMEKLVFRGTVDEVDVGKLAEGQVVRFTVGALPDEDVRGVLHRISPKARRQESTTLFDVEAEITHAGGQMLRAGYSATARIAITEANDVLVIPERLVRFVDGEAFVRIPGPDGKPVEQQIVTGLSDGLSVEVKEGLSEGDEVLEPDPSPLHKR